MASATIRFHDARDYLARTLGPQAYEFRASVNSIAELFNGKHWCYITPFSKQATRRHVVLFNIVNRRYDSKGNRVDSDALALNLESLLPDVGERVTLELTLNNIIGMETWTGHVVSILSKLQSRLCNVAVLCFRPPKPGGRSLDVTYTQVNAYFGHHGRNIASLQKTVKSFMLAPKLEYKHVRELILARNMNISSQAMKQPDGYRRLPRNWRQIVGDYCAKKRFNREQSTAIFRFYENRFSILIGLPGTGKTTVIDGIVDLESKFKSKVRVMTDSNKAIQVLVEKACKRLGTDFPSHCYRVKPAFQEVLCEDDERGTWSTTGVPAQSPKDQGSANIWDFFQSKHDPEIKMALGVAIENRFKLLDRGHFKQLWNTEATDLKRLRLYRNWITKIRTNALAVVPHGRSVPVKTTTEKEMAKFEQNLREKLLKHLRRIQQRLIVNAQTIYATTATSGGLLLRHYHPSTLIIDEGSQAAEPDVVFPLILGLVAGSLKRVLIVGDPHQLAPVAMATHNPFSEQGHLSFMKRLVKAGFPTTTLIQQYRMHPDISLQPNLVIYGGRLQNAPSTSTRAGAELFRTITKDLALRSGRSTFPNTNSVTISLNRHKDYTFGSQRKSASHSRYNIQAAMVTARLVHILVVERKIKPSNILIQSFYLDQVQVYRAIFADLPRFKNLQIQTVDGSQGDEALYGIVDCTVLGGGANETTGFLGSERRRWNVAMTRQMAGRIVIGHKDFAKGKHLDHQNPWKLFFDYAKSKKHVLEDNWFHSPPSRAEKLLIDRVAEVRRHFSRQNSTGVPYHTNYSNTQATRTPDFPYRQRESSINTFLEATLSNRRAAEVLLSAHRGNIILATDHFFASSSRVTEVDQENLQSIPHPAAVARRDIRNPPRWLSNAVKKAEERRQG